MKSKLLQNTMLSTMIVLASATYGLSDSKVAAETGEVSSVKAEKTSQIAATSKFKDINVNHYAYDSILWAQERRIIQGYEDGRFKPQKAVTEAQFAKMVSIYFDLKETEEKLDKFTNKQTWNDVHYNSLAAHVVPLNGYFDDNIRNSVVKRGTVAQVLAYIGGYKMGLNDSIDFLLDNKITVGQDQSYKDKDLLKYFGSNNKLTRAQVVTFLYRMNHNDLSEINSNTIISFDNDDRLDKKASEGKNRVDQSLAVGENKIIEDNQWSVESDEGSASWNGSGRPGVSDEGYGNHLDREIEDLDKDNKYSAEIKKVLPNDYVFGAMGDDIMFIERKGKPALSISLVDDYEYSDYIAIGNINLAIYEKSNENIEVAYELSKLFGLKLNKDRFTKNLKMSDNVDDTFVKEGKYRFIKMAGGSYYSVYWDK